MRVNKRVVALRSGVAFPSLPPPPFSAVPPWPDRTGAGEPPRAAVAEPRAAPSLPRPPNPPAAPPSLCPGLLPAPPLEMSAGGGRGPREEQVAGRGRRAGMLLVRRARLRAARDGGAAPGGAGLPCAAGKHPPPRRSVRRGCGAAARCPRPAVCCSSCGLRLSSGWNRPQLGMPRLPRLLGCQPNVHLYLFSLM